MVTPYGMTERLGAVKLGTGNAEPFLGRDYGHERDYSDAVAANIDQEVRRLIDQAHQEAWDVLADYRDVLDTLVNALLERETLDKSEIAEIFAPVTKRSPRAPWTGSANRVPSDRPAIAMPKPKEEA